AGFCHWTIIHLGTPLPESSSDLLKARRNTSTLYLGLASDRVYHPQGLPWRAPLTKRGISTYRHCCRGIFSVTLSVAFRPPVFHWYPILRSPDFPLSPLWTTAIVSLPFMMLAKWYDVCGAF